MTKWSDSARVTVHVAGGPTEGERIVTTAADNTPCKRRVAPGHTLTLGAKVFTAGEIVHLEPFEANRLTSAGVVEWPDSDFDRAPDVRITQSVHVTDHRDP